VETGRAHNFFLKTRLDRYEVLGSSAKIYQMFPAIIEKAQIAERGLSFMVKVNGKIEG